MFYKRIIYACAPRKVGWVSIYIREGGVHGPGEYYLCVQKYISNAAVYIDRFFIPSVSKAIVIGSIEQVEI